MTDQEQIRHSHKVLIAEIKKYQDRLKELRATCQHPTTFEDNYEWAVGHSFLAQICSDCGKVVKNIEYSPFI